MALRYRLDNIGRFIAAAAMLSVFVLGVQAADVAGNWKGQFFIGNTNPTPHPFGLTLSTTGGKLSGQFCGSNCGKANGSIEIKDGKVDGDTISFRIETGESDIPEMHFEGKMNGDTMQFTISGNPRDCGGSECQVGNATANRASN